MSPLSNDKEFSVIYRRYLTVDSVAAYLDIGLDTIRLQKVEKEDGIVLVDLNGLQELLGWLSHFILR